MMNVTQYNDGIIKYRNRYIKLSHLHSFEIKTLGLQNMTKLPRTQDMTKMLLHIMLDKLPRRN